MLLCQNFACKKQIWQPLKDKQHFNVVIHSHYYEQVTYNWMNELKLFEVFSNQDSNVNMYLHLWINVCTGEKSTKHQQKQKQQTNKATKKKKSTTASTS